jgi:uncharacterized protein (TIGR02466 family)
METKYEIIPLFPTPLYVNQIPEQLVLDHIDLLNNEKIIGEDANTPVDNFGNRSQNSYLFDKTMYQNLSSYILQHSSNFAENYLEYDYQHYKFSQSWISVKYPNQEHLRHSHGNSLISGVVFYGEGNKNSSKIKFIREDHFSKEVDLHKSKIPTNDFSYLTYDIDYVPNLLILFPSYLSHAVLKNTTNFPRKSLAFNVIPRDGFGREDHLNELKFN